MKINIGKKTVKPKTDLTRGLVQTNITGAVELIFYNITNRNNCYVEKQ